MDDVLRQLVPITLSICGAAKALDLALGGSWELAAWLLVPVLVMLWRFRFGAALLAIVWLPWVLLSGTTHPLLVVFVAALLAVFGQEGQRRLLYRTQLTALYAGAGFAKLLSESWMSGAVVDGLEGVRPAGILPVVLVVWGTVFLEVGAAALLWMNDRAALLAGLGLHIAIVAGMWSGDPNKTIALLIFNGLAAAMLIATTLPSAMPTTMLSRHAGAPLVS